MSCVSRVTGSCGVFEKKANGIPGFSFWRSRGAERNKEAACESSLVGKQSSRQRKMRLTAPREDYYTVRWGMLLHLSQSKEK